MTPFFPTRRSSDLGELAVGAVHDEIFLVHPRGELDDLGRHREERFVEATEQGHRPFGEAGILDHQPFVLDQSQPGVGRGLRGAVANDRGALRMVDDDVAGAQLVGIVRSEEHTSELQSLMRNSYAVFCLEKKKKKKNLNKTSR